MAMNRAIGVITIKSEGMIRPVTWKKTIMDWPLVVIRSKSRMDWVSQITAVSTPSATMKATPAILKI